MIEESFLDYTIRLAAAKDAPTESHGKPLSIAKPEANLETGDYTPNTDEVRIAYGYWARYPELAKNDFSVTNAEFNRWLAEVIREAKADAWDEGKVAYDFFPNFSVNPYRKERQ